MRYFWNLFDFFWGGRVGFLLGQLCWPHKNAHRNKLLGCHNKTCLLVNSKQFGGLRKNCFSKAWKYPSFRQSGPSDLLPLSSHDTAYLNNFDKNLRHFSPLINHINIKKKQHSTYSLCHIFLLCCILLLIMLENSWAFGSGQGTKACALKFCFHKVFGHYKPSLYFQETHLIFPW